MVDEGSSPHGADTCRHQCNQCDEPEDVSDVLVNLADFNDFAGADDKYSMIDGDFEAFFFDLAKSGIFLRIFKPLWFNKRKASSERGHRTRT